MPPFRVAVRDPGTKSKDHAWAYVGGTFDDIEDVEEFLAASANADREAIEASNLSLPPEERVRTRDYETHAELSDLGYETKVVELVVKREEPDDAGTPRPVEHRWKEVSPKTSSKEG